jgi:hypothetical protein
MKIGKKKHSVEDNCFMAPHPSPLSRDPLQKLRERKYEKIGVIENIFLF